MTARLVIDASVALKWLTPEIDSDRAARVLDLGRDLHAPVFIFMEIANALWFQARAGTTDAARAEAALADFRTGPLRIWQGAEPLPGTIELARRLDHGVYDCAYLALALHLDGHYVTADRRFWKAAQRHTAARERVLLLDQLV